MLIGFVERLKLPEESPLVSAFNELALDDGPSISQGALPVASWLRPFEYWGAEADKYLKDEDLDWTN